MFSAFKKLTGRSEGAGPPPGPTSLPPALSQPLQKKFSKGVHYNMKIIIKGDRNVGKSALFKRLQGLPFSEEYTATEEIAVANITWNYKNSEDIVKVEVWDVVDVSGKRKRLPTDKLKLENSNIDINGTGDAGGLSVGLDATTIDVYKNTHGAILTFDLTKAWTWDYVKREAEAAPGHLPLLILGNRRDMGHHRAVATDTALYFVEGLTSNRDGEVRYSESSMRYGFGLKFVHKFFCLPYLTLQRQALLKQLEQNEQETDVIKEELDLYAETEDADYDLFIESLSQKRRQRAEALSTAPKLSVTEAEALAKARAIKDAKDDKEAAEAAKRLSIKSDPSKPANLPVGAPGRKKPVPSSMNSELGKIPSHTPNSTPSNVDEFIPDEDLGGFLDEGQGQGGSKDNGLVYEDPEDSDEGERGNPMVAIAEEDFTPIDADLHLNSQLQGGNSYLSSPCLNPLSSDSETEKEDIQQKDEVISSAKPGFDIFLSPPPSLSISGGSGSERPESRSSAEKDPEKRKKKKKDKEKTSKSHHKKKKEPKKHQTDLDEFLGAGGGAVVGGGLDSSAYEAL